MKPFQLDELTSWRAAWKTVERFHGFFDACRGIIGEALGADAVSGSKGATAGYVYQDYRWPDGTRVVVGLSATDEGPVSSSSARHAPFVWMAINAHDRDDWKALADRLDSTPPAGWSSRDTRWWERPRVWRYFDEIIGSGSFEEQRERLALACARAAVEWLRTADESSGSPGADEPAVGAAIGDEDDPL